MVMSPEEDADDAAARRNPIYGNHCFDNIDHVVTKKSKTVLLSMKASKWTIQLGQAVELNRSLATLVKMREKGELNFDEIIVATFYGKSLTDKYDLVRGIVAGKAHDVKNIKEHVIILAGRHFWTWIGDSEDTQFWVMQGIQQAIAAKKDDLKDVLQGLKAFNKSFTAKYNKAMSESGNINWEVFLKLVNG